MKAACNIPNCRNSCPAREAFCHKHRGIGEEVKTIANRLRHTSQGDWLARYDQDDEEFLPPRMHMAFLRMGVVSPDQSPDGGYMLTPLGIAISEWLKPEPGSDEWLKQSIHFHSGDIS